MAEYVGIPLVVPGNFKVDPVVEWARVHVRHDLYLPTEVWNLARVENATRRKHMVCVGVVMECQARKFKVVPTLRASSRITRLKNRRDHQNAGRGNNADNCGSDHLFPAS